MATFAHTNIARIEAAGRIPRCYGRRTHDQLPVRVIRTKIRLTSARKLYPKLAICIRTALSSRTVCLEATVGRTPRSSALEVARTGRELVVYLRLTWQTKHHLYQRQSFPVLSHWCCPRTGGLPCVSILCAHLDEARGWEQRVACLRLRISTLRSMLGLRSCCCTRSPSQKVTAAVPIRDLAHRGACSKVHILVAPSSD
jgi:hypothetical protein